MACDRASVKSASGRFLGDAPQRSYAAKLEHFAAFIAPDLPRIFSDLRLPTHGNVLDLGCGSGLASAILAGQTVPDVRVIGHDLSKPHLQAARSVHSLPLIQADMEHACFREQVFELVWSCNTINHAADPVSVLRALRKTLTGTGRIAIAQSGLLPEMFFAWDAHLDDAVRMACHSYYRERYGLTPEATAGIRGIVGFLRSAGFTDISSTTYAIERVQPLSETDRGYFQHAVFEGLWGDKIRPWLDLETQRKLDANCGPESPEYCLDREDFHHIQTLTVCVGSVPGAD
jgi:SAM-dependent methyltransferase